MYFIIPLLERKKVHLSHYSYPHTYNTIISDTSSLAWNNYYIICIWARIHAEKKRANECLRYAVGRLRDWENSSACEEDQGRLKVSKTY